MIDDTYPMPEWDEPAPGTERAVATAGWLGAGVALVLLMLGLKRCAG